MSKPTPFSERADVEVWCFSVYDQQWEVVPAFWLEADRYEICALPFFKENLNVGDTIITDPDFMGTPIYLKTVKKSGWKTFWIIGQDIDWITLARGFESFDCLYEQYSEQRFSISVKANWAKKVELTLYEGMQAGAWQYCLSTMTL